MNKKKKKETEALIHLNINLNKILIISVVEQELEVNQAINIQELMNIDKEDLVILIMMSNINILLKLMNIDMVEIPVIAIPNNRVFRVMYTRPLALPFVCPFTTVILYKRRMNRVA